MKTAAVKFSAREHQIKKLDRVGFSRKGIALALNISTNTVYAHLARIRLKTSTTRKTR